MALGQGLAVGRASPCPRRVDQKNEPYAGRRSVVCHHHAHL